MRRVGSQEEYTRTDTAVGARDEVDSGGVGGHGWIVSVICEK